MKWTQERSNNVNLVKRGMKPLIGDKMKLINYTVFVKICSDFSKRQNHVNVPLYFRDEDIQMLPPVMVGSCLMVYDAFKPKT